MNKQRDVIYSERRQILEGVSLKEQILEIAATVLEDLSGLYLSDNLSPQEWNLQGLREAMKLKFGLEIDPASFKEATKAQIKQILSDKVNQAYKQKEEAIGEELLRHLERMVFLQIIDTKWKDHLYAMDSLREGIGLRAYGQRDPLIEYKREAFNMFSAMMTGIEDDALEICFKLQPARPERFKGVFSSLMQEMVHPEAVKFEKPSQELSGASLPEDQPSSPQKTIQSTHPKVGRNDPCPCGSGKKYKKCCGR